ncbi:hypothetical protein Tco_0614111, partial [Tanacetum coccineum]
MAMVHRVCLSNGRNHTKNGDYGYDPYDDDMYEGQDIPEQLQAI